MNPKALIITLFLLISILVTPSCHKEGNTPVDQYISLLDEATEKTKKISNISELINVPGIISQEDALAIIRANPYYKLSEKDKTRIKKSFEHLLRSAFEKTIEFSQMSSLDKEQAKTQIDLIIAAANKKIDQATSLGDLGGI